MTKIQFFIYKINMRSKIMLHILFFKVMVNKEWYESCSLDEESSEEDDDAESEDSDSSCEEKTAKPGAQIASSTMRSAVASFKYCHSDLRYMSRRGNWNQEVGGLCVHHTTAGDQLCGRALLGISTEHCDKYA